MSRPGVRRAAALCAALALALAPADEQADVGREWRVRRWALDPAAHERELVAALASEAWPERCAALDALARAPCASPAALIAAAPALLADLHPNVRSAALAALRRPECAPLARAAARRLASDPLPEARVELARTLGERGCEDTDPVLARLAFDADGAVAAESRAALMARGGAASAAQADVLERLWGAGEDSEWLAMVALAARSSEPGDLCARLAARPAEGRSERGNARAAVLAAVRLLRGEPAAAQELAAGWLARLGAPDGAPAGAGADGAALERRRRDLLLRAAARAGEPAGWPLFRALASGGPWTADQAGFLIEGAAAALAPQDLARAALDAGLGAETERALWERIGVEPARWSAAAVGPWLAPERPAPVRAAVAGALAYSLARADDRASGELLATLLADESAALRAAALDALADAPDPTPWLAPLFAAWLGLDEGGRQHLLRRLSREHAPVPFRAELLRQGERSADLDVRSPALIELCALFEQDREVGACLERWLAHDLERIEAARGAPERGVELRAQGLLRALARVRGEAALPVVLDALRSTAARDVEVAKVAAALLGQSPAGRGELAAWLDPAVASRVRIEAALWIGAEAQAAVRARAAEVLIERFDTADGELRARILKRFAGLADERTLAFLGRVATGPHPLEERGLALDSLARRAPAPDALAELARVLAEAADLETQRRAIETVGAIGASGAHGAAALLAEVWSQRVDAPPAGSSAQERELVREELLLALARTGGGALCERELLTRPLAAAAADLERRFAGRRGTSTEFLYRAELELARALAAAGRLGAALAAAGPYERIDARLALELGGRALEGAAEAEARGDAGAAADAVEAARALLLAAHVGLAGEAEDEESADLRLAARARLAALARAERRWSDAERWTRELLGEWRAGRVGERAWAELFGREARTREAAQAWVECALEQASAWSALERGERDAARRHAERAGARVGASAAARAEQERLAAAVE